MKSFSSAKMVHIDLELEWPEAELFFVEMESGQRFILSIDPAATLSSIDEQAYKLVLHATFMIAKHTHEVIKGTDLHMDIKSIVEYFSTTELPTVAIGQTEVILPDGFSIVYS